MSVKDRPLAPNQVARRLFGAAPDRDERAPQLIMEMLLTLWANDYQPPATRDALKSPKRRNELLRSLAIGENFAHNQDGAHDLGRRLAAAADFASSENLPLAQEALQTLVDRDTLRGTNRGTVLLLPVAESVLWYDARRSGARGRWDVRRVYMRGTGITLARMLLQPPDPAGQATEMARVAVDRIREALQSTSPFGELSAALDRARPETSVPMSEEEFPSWSAGGDERLGRLASRVIRHAHAVMTDPGTGPQAKLMNLRTVLSLDVALHIAEQSWSAAEIPDDQRYFVFSFLPEPRSANRVRWCSEKSFNDAFQGVGRGITAAIRDTLSNRSNEPWSALLPTVPKKERKDAADRHFAEVERMLEQPAPDLDAVAARVYEAPGDGYDRPVGAFRVLLESAGFLVGTGKYRYLRPTPSTLGALIAARTNHEPETAEDFMRFLFDEWRVIVGEGEAVSTRLTRLVDGAELRRNAEHMESLLTAAGLATALSDQTCMVGRRIT